MTLTKRDLVPCIGRWWPMTLEFNFEIEHRPGSHLAHVDALSRNPLESSESFNKDEILSINIIRIDKGNWVLPAHLVDNRCIRYK